MPRTRLDATTPTELCSDRTSRVPTWCQRMVSGLRKSAGLLSAAALVGLGASSAEAQLPPGQVRSVQEAPMYYQGGQPDAGAAAIAPVQYAPNQQAWPNISPYYPANVLSTTHINKRGLWMQEIAQKNREHYFSAEAVWFNIENPSVKAIGQSPLPGAVGGTGQITGPPVPSSVFVLGDGAAGIRAGSALESLFDQLPPSFILAGPGIFPYPLLPFDEIDPLEADLDLVASSAAYPIRTLADVGAPSSVGTRIKWGYDNGDGSGLELAGFYSGEGHSTFTSGTDNINGFPINVISAAINLTQISEFRRGAIPLDNGLPTFPVIGDNLGITGSTQKYDIFYQASHSTQLFGASASRFLTSLIRTRTTNVRLFWGADYTNIDDTFRFRGIDSGVTVDLEDLQSTSGALPGGNTGGGGGGTTVTSNFGGTGNTATPGLTPLSPDRLFEAWLNSNTQTNLAGPTVGLRYEFGKGKKFKMWGETVFGLLANQERTVISSQNIAEQTHSKTVYGTDLDAFSNPDGSARPDDFARATYSRSDTHVSPMFKQGIHAELAVGGLIPPLAGTALFENAVFTAGYQITVLGEIQRAGQAIYWRGFTGDRANSFPFPISDRSIFTWQEANLGVEWTF